MPPDHIYLDALYNIFKQNVEEQESGEWIPIAAEPPKIGQIVITLNDSYQPLNIAKFETGRGFVDIQTDRSLTTYPTYWLELPARPKDF